MLHLFFTHRIEELVRTKSALFIQLMLDSWPKSILQPYKDDLEFAIRKGVVDKFSDAAYSSGLCQKSFTKHWPFDDAKYKLRR
jgi:hypothetical protein